MNLRRCKAATVSAGAISAACQCKCQRSAGASQAADGVSCQSGMIPRWPPPPLSPRARAGVALALPKAGVAYERNLAVGLSSDLSSKKEAPGWRWR